MCRLAYFSNKAIKYFSRKQLVKLFNYLERQNGGHGCGIGGLLTNNHWYLLKGLKVTNVDLVEKLKRNSWKNGAILHWRLASSGEINNFLCHPFLALDYDVLLAHNGHVYGASDYLKILKKLYPTKYGKFEYGMGYSYQGYYWNKTDFKNGGRRIVSDSWVATEILSWLHKTWDNDLLVKKFSDLIDNSSNFFIQLDDGTVYLVVHNRDFEIYYDNDMVVAVSSGLEFFFEEKEVYTMDRGIVRVKDGKVAVIEGTLKRLDKVREERRYYYRNFYSKRSVVETPHRNNFRIEDEDFDEDEEIFEEVKETVVEEEDREDLDINPEDILEITEKYVVIWDGRDVKYIPRSVWDKRRKYSKKYDYMEYWYDF